MTVAGTRPDLESIPARLSRGDLGLLALLVLCAHGTTLLAFPTVMADSERDPAPARQPVEAGVLTRHSPPSRRTTLAAVPSMGYINQAHGLSGVPRVDRAHEHERWPAQPPVAGHVPGQSQRRWRATAVCAVRRMPTLSTVPGVPGAPAAMRVSGHARCRVRPSAGARAALIRLGALRADTHAAQRMVFTPLSPGVRGVARVGQGAEHGRSRYSRCRRPPPCFFDGPSCRGVHRAWS